MYKIELFESIYHTMNSHKYTKGNSDYVRLLRENKEKLWNPELSANPAAIEILKENPEMIDWMELSKNPAAIDLLRANPRNINWNHLFENPKAIELLETIDWSKVKKYPEKKRCPCYSQIACIPLPRDPSAIAVLQSAEVQQKKAILESLMDAFVFKEDYWEKLSRTDSAYAVRLLKEHPDKICWISLSANPAAIELLKENLDKVDWSILSYNSSAIDLLKANPDKIDWDSVNDSPYRIELLKDNPDKIDWDAFCSYKCLEYDYEEIKKDKQELHRELHELMYHPSRIAKWIDDGNCIDNYL